MKRKIRNVSYNVFFQNHTYFRWIILNIYKNRENRIYSKSPHTHYPDSTIVNILPEFFKIKSKNCNLFILQFV